MLRMSENAQNIWHNHKSPEELKSGINKEEKQTLEVKIRRHHPSKLALTRIICI